MRKHLKEKIEELVSESVRDIQGKNSLNPKGLNPKRIVLHSSCKIKPEYSVAIFSYMQNLFYNTQWHIDNSIPVAIIPSYKAERHGEEDDYTIDVGVFLERYFIDTNKFLKP